jgi:hypothetical protein
VLRGAAENAYTQSVPHALSRASPWFSLAALIAGLAVATVYYASGLLHHDASFLLIATRRWLHGAVLYQDIMEINPPLIFYLTAPAVMVSDMFSVSSASVFVVFVCALAGISTAWCWNLLSRIEQISRSERHFVVAACFVGLVFAPTSNFGQREHLFIILALPYFIAFGLAPFGVHLSKMERTAMGLFSLFGFALKPFFLIPAILLAAMLSWKAQNLRLLRDPANVAIGAGCGLYVLLVALIHPAYFTMILPMGLAVYDWVATDTAGALSGTLVPMLLVAAAATIAGDRGRVRDSLLALSAVAFGLVLTFAVQRKIWEYQLLPFHSFAVVLAALAAVLARDRILARPAHLLAFAAVPVLLFFIPPRDVRYESEYADKLGTRLQELTADWSDRSVLVLTTNVSAAFPLINRIGAEWAGRYPYQWLIAGALTRQAATSCVQDENACEQLRSILDYARRTNVDDLAVRAPSVVLIDQRLDKSYLPGRDFDYVGFLKDDPRFAALWSHYQRWDTALDYDIWVRASDSSRVK